MSFHTLTDFIRDFMQPYYKLYKVQMAEYSSYAGLILSLAAVLLLVSLPWVSKRRKPWAVYLIVLALGASGAAFGLSTWVVQRVGAERMAVLRAMWTRPDDPWPRGSGHVPLGPAGSAETSKGYLEPGGAFSPALGSFGLSFWIVDDSGALVTTGDKIPISRTQARYTTSPTGGNGIQVETDYYSATWVVEGHGAFRLSVVSRTPPNQQLEIAIRGVGPAGGPLHHIQLNDKGSIHINNAWTISVPAPTKVTFAGEEGSPGWTRRPEILPDLTPPVVSKAGWAHARLAIPSGSAFELKLRNGDHRPNRIAPAGLKLVLDGVDPVFAEALRSQITTLQIGTVGDQTRPGEPVSYPLSWLRDGAYILVALARAGQMDLARRLSGEFARRDFFGGFGAEGDGPGLAIWALCELSAVLGDQSFDLEIWPHVRRKAESIREILHATSDIRYSFSGPAVPKMANLPDLTLVAGPSQDGLINGRMDWHRPLFYVNAVSYAGLVRAADIAKRLGHIDYATTLANEAQGLQAAWNDAFTRDSFSDQKDNERTAIAGLWPSDIAAVGAYSEHLHQRWSQTRDLSTGAPLKRPLWTYFTVAEAHQWLRLGRSDRAWQTIEWFWSQQPIPGLYTLWEGNAEENSFDLWKKTRGWVTPPNVTPHYWSAAEMLLLQVAMLAEVQGDAASRELVIGSGVPVTWLSRPIMVAGLGTSAGLVDWSWDGENVEVTIRGEQLPVRLGPAFPSTAKLAIRVAAHENRNRRQQ